MKELFAVPKSQDAVPAFEEDDYHRLYQQPRLVDGLWSSVLALEQ